MGPNHQQSLHPLTLYVGRGSTSDIGHSGLDCGGWDSGAVVSTDFTEKTQQAREL